MEKVVLKHESAYGELFEEEFKEYEGLFARVSQLRSENSVANMGYAVELVRKDGRIMSVGLGVNEWMVYVTDEDGSEEAIAIGDPAAHGTAWFHFGAPTEVEAKYLIPQDTALKAIQTWCENGSFSDAAKWM